MAELHPIIVHFTVALAVVGVLLRVYHEAVHASRGPAAASLRGSSAAKLREEPLEALHT